MHTGRLSRAALLPAFGLAVFLASCGKDETVPPPPVRPVLSLLITPKAPQGFGPFVGTVEPRYQAALGFRTSGRMVSRDANVGDTVAKGELLASLDPRVAQFALTSARADLANATAQLVNANATQERQRTLLQTQSVSQADVDSAVAARDTAQAKVNQAQASLVKAQEQAGYAALTSDYDGVITNWALEVGQVVSAGQTVVTVARPDIRDAVFDVPDDLIGKVVPDAAFMVSLQADTSVTVTGTVREIAPAADTATRTRRIRLTLVAPPPVFRLGTTVTMTLPGSGDSVIAVPASAVLDQDGQASVWLVTPGLTVARRTVTLGARRDDAVVVTTGLAAGERVVTAGVHSLSDGQPIKLLEP
jgi:RND family efflux transporter MFP subunit